ncbi:FAD-dependent oxidoreductase [Luteolibacter yonseiensis]|uniref:FAD-dependent oxidoreductase n=1 Tax=Luteolibacter yonseiensis TaxID=1144680 RepID=A0A934R2D8_9BACT|nr:FAD-dependent oxidoreductase [Luteolibacter yonseiensis]MBK1814060.1 FAD-dependent oxidoreductase [Luteolibacter yonseiensis]
MKPAGGTFDVAVIGGGSAGLAAAVTAAREGARTVLIERHGFLGGMGTASLVHSFCGLYLLRKEPGAVLANPGFPTEMAERMAAATGLGPVRMGRVDVLPQHPVEFVRIADAMVSAEPLLEVRLHTEVVAVARGNGGGNDAREGHQPEPGRESQKEPWPEPWQEPWVVSLADRGGVRSLRAHALVDASGDAVVAGLLGGGAEMAESPRLQRPAYVFGVRCGGVPDDEVRLETAGLVVEGIRKGDLPQGALGISFRASGRPGEVFGTLDLAGGEGYDPLDAGCLGGLEMEGRAVASRVMAWLAGRSDFWKHSYISHWPVRAGVRESRRWIGETVLTGADVLAGRRFEDEIALATWPMEFRENARGPKLKFPEGDRPTGIPLGCLKPRGVDGLFVAGRCISADHDAQASVRVMGTCFATGEAAGRAAVGACRVDGDR